MKKIYLAFLVALVATLSCQVPSSGPSEDAIAPTVADVLAQIEAGPPASPLPDIRPRPRPPSTFVPASSDTRSQKDIAAAACWGFEDGHKAWRCKGKPPQTFMAEASSPIIPSSWTVPLWVTDPANSIGCASDTNTGTSATCVGGCSGSVCTSGNGPLVTMNELIVHRWGTSSPMLQQTTDIWPISSETVGQERIRPLTPVMANAGSNFSVICTPTAIGTSFAAGVVTAKSQANPGTDLTIATMPAGAATGVIVQNQSRLGADGKPSYAIIHSMLGATATMDQPFNNTTTVALNFNVTENNSWTTGDTLQLLSPCVLNLTSVDVQVTDSNAARTSGIAWFSQLHVPDISGTNGKSNVNITGHGSQYWGMSVFDPFTNITDAASSGTSLTVAGCQFNGVMAVEGTNADNRVVIYGGDIGSGFSAAQQLTIYHDPIVAGTITSTGFLGVGSLHLTGALLIYGSAQTFLVDGMSVWGAGTIKVNPSSAFTNGTGNTWAATAPVNLLEFVDAQGNAQTTGTSYAAGVWTDGITISPTNLDANNGGLQNPRTGARFAKQ